MGDGMFDSRTRAANRRALDAGHSVACVAAAQSYWQHDMGAPCICRLALRPPSETLAELDPPRAERTTMTKLEEAAKAYRDACKQWKDADARCKAAREESDAAGRAREQATEDVRAREEELQKVAADLGQSL